jgi:hypothetical protein
MGQYSFRFNLRFLEHVRIISSFVRHIKTASNENKDVSRD